jgi:hypothetical protein
MKADHLNHAETPAEHAEAPHDEPPVEEASSTAMATVATVGVVAVGAVIFEAALIPGLVLGVAAALAPRYVPKLGTALTPLFRSTVRGAYRLGRKSREMVAEVQEHIGDIAAEVSSEEANKTAAEGVAHAEAAATAHKPVSH